MNFFFVDGPQEGHQVVQALTTVMYRRVFVEEEYVGEARVGLSGFQLVAPDPAATGS